MGTKSDLLVCLEDCCATLRPDAPDTNVTIIEGAALVNILKPMAAKTFTEYALNVVCPYIQSQFQHADRVDIVWDQYQENNLKTRLGVKATTCKAKAALTFKAKARDLASEAKAKDWSFKAKAKDIISWPRGSSRPRPRPRGLHLWLQTNFSF